jgi:hypothetical protein
MPKLFYRAAYEAACRDAPPKQFGRLTDAHFESDPAALEEALGWLTPEQLCDAFYGDWLLQLHHPGGETQLQVRSLLIGKGALAANYLAELAQNADDAFDERDGAEIRLLVEGDWLLVANNGRRVTPGNLRGLCRFFVHSGGKIRALDAETIGRFGIGFKSCYRIASEVLVRSWDGRGETIFRLPISKAGDSHSWPDAERLKRVAERLRLVGAPVGEDLLTHDRLGYCTPEFLSTLPTALPAAVSGLQNPKRGTIFAFHLHTAGAAEVRARISGQEHDLYELCPLFLPKVRTVQLGASELVMKLGREDPADGLPRRVSAVRATLETTRGDETARDRFWKLQGIADGDHWQIALHADSKALLNFKNDDESRSSLRDGGAYAFFPLNDANRDFFFRFHLHIDLPTNLSRGDWNDEERENVREQIGRAVDALAEWLETHAAKRHPDWQIERLFRQEPHEGALWSHEIFTRLKQALRDRPLLRTLWGLWRRAPEALSVRLSMSGIPRRAWRELCAEASYVGDQFPFVETTEQIDLGIPPAGGDHLRAFFAAAALHPAPTPDFWRNMLHSILGAEVLTPKQIEEALGRVPVELRAGGSATVAQLMQRAEGAELVDQWHTAFRSAAKWLEDDRRHTISVFGAQLGQKLRQLGEPKFSVEWDEVAAKMVTLDDWVEKGDRFWALQRPVQCPAALRDEVIASLRVKHGRDLWQPLTDVWLLDTSAVRCFHGVVRAWDRGTAPNNQAQTRARQRLDDWGLLRPYEIALEEKLEENLTARLLEIFEEHPEQPLAVLCEPGHCNSRDTLPHSRWKTLVSDAENAALEGFLTSHQPPSASTVYLSTKAADVPFHVRRILALLLPNFTDAPRWLSKEAWTLIVDHGLADEAGFEFVEKITTERRTNIAESLLRKFWQWKDNLSAADADGLAALDELFSDVRGTWTVGLAANRTAILNQLFVRVGKDPHSPAEQAWECTMAHAGKPEWHADFLPEPLTHLPHVVAVCPGPASLRLEAPAAGSAMAVERVHPDILAVPSVATLISSREWRVEHLTSLHLLWKAQGTAVCEIRDAQFVFHGDRFIVSRRASALDQDQYRRVLTTYDLHAPEDREFRQANRDGQPADKVYEIFRERILRVLRERLVMDEGYEERHVLRELLQNAESAYASRAGEPLGRCPFHVRSEPAAASIRVVAIHCGRAFNDPDVDGKSRDDIVRIVSLRAGNQNAPDEIGRFNRGFKSVFTVTTNVQVRSGAYDFGIEDLLLLHPAEPAPLAEPINETRFTFECGRADAQKLFGTTGGQTFSVFHAASFVFLRYVDEITIEHGGDRRQWVIHRHEREEGWSEVAIETVATGERERFLVYSGVSTRAKGRRFGAAIRIGEGDAPQELEPAWNRLCLTFPTETVGPCGVLINADFDTDGGRVDVRHSAVNESLIKDALDAVAERLRDRARIGMERPEWLGWARVLAVSDAVKWVAANFPRDPLNIRELLAECGQKLLSCVPHEGELVVPSRLMRELAASEYAVEWDIASVSWIDAELDAQVAKIDPEARVRYSLRDFAWSLRGDSTRSARVLAGLQAPQFLKLFKLNAVDANELREAVNWLASLQVTVIATTTEETTQGDFDFGRIDPATVLEWWQDNDDPDDYTLDSAVLWPLFGPDGLDDEDRRTRLVAGLSAPETPEGQRLWYKVLGFACLMSAGWPVERVRRFWTEKLAPEKFWEHTEKDFGAADAIFEKVIGEEVSGANAAGEDAIFWRRIFYDVRKVRHLIYVNDFAAEVMDLAADSRSSAHLLQFLKTGKIPGSRAHRGVLGQSAGSPLFFVVRELRRLEVIKHQEVDASAFFVCKPVRELAARLGWIDPKLAASYDFESLGEASHQIHAAAMAGGSEHVAVFRKWFDIPLLHYALNHS